MKIFLLFLLFYVINMQFALSQKADAGRDTVNCKSKGVMIGGEGEDDWCYSWEPATGLSDPKILHPIAKPKVKTTYKLTVIGPEFSLKEIDEIDVDVLDSVKFEPDLTQSYGFDDGKYTGPGAGVKWKSVEEGKSDPANINVFTPEAAKYVNIKSNSEGVATVSPSTPAASPTKLIITGAGKGSAKVQARCCDETGEELDEELNVTTYKVQKNTLGVRLVHEQNDDVQLVSVGQGKANQVAITHGASGTLITTAAALGGDDIIQAGSITTGADGICQTNAAAGDIVKVAFGKGLSNQICIEKGTNNFRDTKPLGDDVVVGDDISTGPDGICNTTAKAVDVLSGHYSEASILAFLNNVLYKQAVCEWTLVILPTLTINADLDRDGHIAVVHGGDEAQAIIDNCKDDSYDYNLFFVNDVLIPGAGQRVGAVVDIGSKYVFIDVNGHGSTLSVDNTAGHELGHAQGLRHPTSSACNAGDPSSNYDDPENIMDYCNKNQLRKFQWDIVNKQ